MKKALSLVLATLMLVFVFAGCTVNVGDSGSQNDSSDVSISDSSADDSSSESSVDDSSSESSETTTGNTDYLSWTAEDWDAASQTEKENCTLAYLMYIAELMGQDDLVTEDMMRPQIENTIDAVELLFNTMELGGFNSLKEAADAGFSALQSE